jgi:hypothetical protein
MNKKDTITNFYTKGKNLAEIYSSGLQYAFVAPNGDQCHQFVYCKDFLQDCLGAIVNKTVASIYGFSYNPETNPPVDLEHTRIALTFSCSKEEFAGKMTKALSLVNEVEKAFGLSKSKGKWVGEYKSNPVWLIVGDKQWMLAPPLLSLYTILLRLGSTYSGDDWVKFLTTPQKGAYGQSEHDDRDSRYLSAASKVFWESLNKNSIQEMFGEEMSKNYPNIPIMSMHNNTGFESYHNGGYKSVGEKLKHWKKIGGK